MCLALILLLFQSPETRCLNPRLEKSLTRSNEALIKYYRELRNMELGKDEHAKTAQYKPNRESPGGPDPRHH